MTPRIWEIKLKMRNKWINEIDNGKLLWAMGKEGVKLLAAMCRKQWIERDQRKGKVS